MTIEAVRLIGEDRRRVRRLRGAVKLLTRSRRRARGCWRAAMAAAGRDRPPRRRPSAASSAEDVHAIRDQPPFPASAMDGWADRAADAPGALQIVGESAAGHGLRRPRCGPGEAVRIFTGAARAARRRRGRDPGGRAARRRRGRASRRASTPATTSARPAATSRGRTAAGRGDAARSPGACRSPPRRARASLQVAARPRRGSPLHRRGDRRPGRAAGSLPDLRLRHGGAGGARQRLGRRESQPPGMAGDDDEAIAATVGGRASGDLLVTLGGASVGDHDLVKPALSELGLELAVESVNVRPGKPTWFGRLADGRLRAGPARQSGLGAGLRRAVPAAAAARHAGRRAGAAACGRGWRAGSPPTARASTGCGRG